MIHYFDMIYDNDNDDVYMYMDIYSISDLNCLIFVISFHLHQRNTMHPFGFFVDPPDLCILTAGSRSTDLFLWNPASATCISTTAGDAAAAAAEVMICYIMSPAETLDLCFYRVLSPHF